MISLTPFQPNPQMAGFSARMNLEKRKRNGQLILDYLCVASGGPTLYVSLGQDMKTAHEGLGISASDRKIGMDHVQRAISKPKVPDREGEELLASFLSLSDQKSPGRETPPTHPGAAGSPVDQNWPNPGRGRPFGP